MTTCLESTRSTCASETEATATGRPMSKHRPDAAARPDLAYRCIMRVTLAEAAVPPFLKRQKHFRNRQFLGGGSALGRAQLLWRKAEVRVKPRRKIRRTVAHRFGHLRHG